MIKQEIVDKALAVINKGGANYVYFFDNLTSPDWIEPLAKHKLFTAPPDIIREGDYVRFPTWPESQYLKRVAADAPAIVLNTLLKLPVSENPRVHDDILEAALAMPSKFSERLVKQVIGYVRAPYHTLLPYKIGEFILHLARNGYEKSALSLAREVLALQPDPRAAERHEEGLTPDPIPYIDKHNYEQLLSESFPEIVRLSGQKALFLLLDLLESYIQLSRLEESYAGSEDLSYIQRPAIEDSEQNWNHNLVDTIIVAVRDAAETLCREKPELLPSVLEQLEARPWRVFWRIALYLLYALPEASLELAAPRLLNRSYFESAAMRHEYARLSKYSFGILKPQEQQTILAWIDEQDHDKLKALYEEYWGKSVTDDLLLDIADNQRLARLAPIKESLPADWRRRYDDMSSRLGEPDHPEFLVHSSGVMTGPNSPRTSDELSAMSVAEIVEFIHSWVPPVGEFMGDSPEGLGRELRSAVLQNASKYAEAAEMFIGTAPTYIRGMLGGLEDAVRAGIKFPWPSALRLCRWALQQSIEPERPESIGDEDPSWGWTRQQIASLLRSALSKEGLLPFPLREAIWQLIVPLTDDPDPTPEHEVDYGGSNMDPATLALNTVRGEAIQAVVQYALWVHRILNKAEDKRQVQVSFSDMPEVQTVLDRHLDPEHDPSPAIRSVYGQYLPWLVLIDKPWVHEHLLSIFPTDEALRHLRDAAWNAYVCLTHPYDSMVDVLADEYLRAVEETGSNTENRNRFDPHEALTKHLMTYLGRGKMDADKPEGPIARLFATANQEVRAHALRFVGQVLREQTDNLPTDTMARFRHLWEVRVAAAESSLGSENAQPMAEEMAQFGWWFASNGFDNGWSLQQLKSALRLANHIEPGHAVLERLAVIAPSLPLEAFECLLLLLSSRKNSWDIDFWRDDISQILKAALNCGDAELSKKTEETIHRLGAQGEFHYRTLLK